MDNRIRNLWVEALRSGQYKQTTGHLKDHKGYCCLGVLCSIYIQENPRKAEWVSDGGCGYSLRDKITGQVYATNTLPQPVVEWAGVREENPTFCLPKKMDHNELASVNDDLEESFNRIADRIQFGAQVL